MILKPMIVLPGPASIELGKRIADELGVIAQTVDHRIFPDGESYIRLTGPVTDEVVAIVQTTAPYPDQKLMQLLLTAGTANDFGATRVIAVVPYIAYSRQDKRFLDGEALSLDVVIRLMENVGITDLIVVDTHNSVSLQMIEERRHVKIHNVSAIPLLAEYLKNHGYKGALSLSPDKGAIHHAKAAALVLGGPTSLFEKIRDRKTGEIIMAAKDLDVKGKRAVVFDDIISSGGTMAMAVAVLKEQGADKVAAACSHALFMGGAEEKIRKAGADIILAADTVETQYSQVSIAGVIAAKLRELCYPQHL